MSAFGKVEMSPFPEFGVSSAELGSNNEPIRDN
jgi:hypothetical protein